MSALQRWQISHPRLCLCPNLLSADRPALMADPRPIRGKPRSTPRGFRLSGRTASDETATRDCNEGRAPMPVGALFRSG